MRLSSLCLIAFVLSPALNPWPLAAQPAAAPRAVCWRAAPKASCRVIILTNFGISLLVGSRETVIHDPVTGFPSGATRPIRVGGRVVGDWGLLVNVGQRDALGVSLLGSGETIGSGEQFELSTFLRYRRWLGQQRSLDFGVGMPVILRNSSGVRSPYGLVKLNLNSQWGVALRPEVRRYISFSTAPPIKRSTMFLSAGVEGGEWPGFILSSLGATILGLYTLIGLANLD